MLMLLRRHARIGDLLLCDFQEQSVRNLPERRDTTGMELTQLPDPKLQHLVLARQHVRLGLVKSRIVALSPAQ